MIRLFQQVSNPLDRFFSIFLLLRDKGKEIAPNADGGAQ